MTGPVDEAIGAALGVLVGRLVLYLRRAHKEAVGLDDFLALGLIALAYGVALLAHAYGFLAVFAAGVALRRVERLHTGDEPPEDVKTMAFGTSHGRAAYVDDPDGNVVELWTWDVAEHLR